MREPRKFFASTACVAKQFTSLAEQIAGMTAAGIMGIELGHSAPIGDFSLPADLVNYSATKFLLHNYFPAPRQSFVLNLASSDPENLARSREFCLRAIMLCAALEVPFYSVHSGFLAEFAAASLGKKLQHGAIADYETGWKTFTESLRILLAAGKRAGVQIAVEPNVVAPMNLVEGRNPLLMLAEPHEFSRLLAEFGSADLKVLLDLGHLRVTAQTLGFSMEEFVEVVAVSIAGFHLHDNDATADQHLVPASDSWVFPLIQQPRFAQLPVVIEAQFNDVHALQHYCGWLEKNFS